MIPVTIECEEKLSKSRVAASLCILPKPDVAPTNDCDAGLCPEIYKWSTKYSSCSETCGEGSKKYFFVLSIKKA